MGAWGVWDASCFTGSPKWPVQNWVQFWLDQPHWMTHCFSLYPQWPWKSHRPWADKPGSCSWHPCKTCTDVPWIAGVSWLSVACRNDASKQHQQGRQWACGAWCSCQETSTRDTANTRSLELCASIVFLFLDGCSEWYVSVEFLTGQVFGNWIA